MNMLQSLSSIFSEPGVMEGFTKGAETAPEILLKVVHTWLNGFFHMQQEWIKKGGRIRESAESYKFENLEQDLFRAWSEMYEKEFRQFFKMPQLGLTRYYQERMNRTADRSNLFQHAVGEFLYIIYMPIEKSFQVMQQKLAIMAKEGQFPDNTKDFYNMWIKSLEGHYMTLFKSPEYTQSMSKLINSMGTFMVARQEMLQDILQLLPIPSNKEMDELYKEVYNLKKRIRQLEKKNK